MEEPGSLPVSDEASLSIPHDIANGHPVGGGGRRVNGNSAAYAIYQSPMPTMIGAIADSA